MASASTVHPSPNNLNLNDKQPPSTTTTTTITAKVREEGELSSSDDDALPMSSVRPSTFTSDPPSSSIPNASMKTHVRAINSGKPVSAYLPAKYADIQPQTTGNCKDLDKKQGLLKPSSPAWCAPGGSSNLVIDFSDDDDSCSDSEERRHSCQVPAKRSQVAKNSEKPPALPHVKVDAAKRFVRNVGKGGPKKGSLTRPLTSSITKVHGPSARGTGLSLGEQRSWLNNSNVTSRSFSKQDHGCRKSLNLGSSKLQDLRQQIAMRENELKLKMEQKNKESVSEPSRDVNGLGKDMPKKGGEVPSDVETEDKEPDKKRLKVGQDSSEQPSSSGLGLKLAESVLALKEPLFKDPIVCQDGNMADRALHDIDHSRKGLLPYSDGRPLNPTIQSDGIRLPRDAPGVAVSTSFSGWVSRPEEILTMAKKTTALTNTTFAEEPLFKDPINCQDGNKADRSLHDIGNTRKGLLSYSNERPLDPAIQSDGSRVSPDAPGVAASTGLSDWVSRPGETLTIAKQTTALTNSTFADPLDKFVSLENSSFLHSLGSSRATGCGDVDVHSLFEMEELHDKELEEAQVHRQRCEIEERNALKAYRRAQTALAEANARCTCIYQRRELYSAQLHSLLMENPRLLWSSDQQKQIGEAWNLNLPNAVADVNLDLIQRTSRHMQTEFETANQLGYDLNAGSVDGDAHNRSCGNEGGQNLGSEACSEPDASSSDMLVQGNRFATNGAHTRSRDHNLSPDDDGGTFHLEHRSIHANVTSSREEDNSKESEKSMDVDSIADFSVDRSRDPVILEAYLRSKLFSRLGMAGASKQNDSGVTNVSAAERLAEEDVTGAKSQMILDIVPHSVPRGSNDDNGGASKQNDSDVNNESAAERVAEEDVTGAKSQMILDIVPHSVFKGSNDDNGECPKEPECSLSKVFPNGGSNLTNILSASTIPLCSIFRSAMRAAGPVYLGDMQTTGKHCAAPDTCNDQNLLVLHDQETLSLDTVKFVEEVAKCVSFGRIDSYTCKSAIDPFWPLCMYELRGRCNNDECPWQHVKDYSSGNVNQHGSPDKADWPIESSSYNQVQRSSMDHSNVLTPPRYLVFLDSLKTESQRCGSLQARQLVSSQKKVFSNSLAVSSSVLKHYPSDVPYLHGNDGCVESYSVGGHPLNFLSRKCAGNGSFDDDQSLEMALLVLNQESNQVEGTKKALSLLSRALEADPVSLHLWVIYLLVYYSTENFVGELSKKGTTGKDDLFLCAVEHNEQSYELWLLYINSRRNLNDRFAAYERALSCFCCQRNVDDAHIIHKSAAVLDLFLQMLYCFCISGNVAKAVQRINELVLTERDSDESHSLLLSDILECLTLSDECIFWVCCVYLVIYRELPDALVQQLEFEKDISAVEWPSVCLTLEEKQQVSEMMKVATNSITLSANNESLENSTLKPAHMIAVNHIKLVVAIDDEESYKTLLEKYRNIYPGCLELILLSARAHGCVNQSTKFEGFEKSLHVWPKEVPGIQCIWNQLTVYALESEGPDRAKEIIEKWFYSVWKPQFLYNQSIVSVEGDNQSCLENPMSGLNLNSLLYSSNKLDIVFGLLNLSLYSLFQNDVLGAHSTLDKALGLAEPELLRHCIREHAVFLLNNGSHLKKDVSVHGLLDIVKAYMIYSPAISTGDPLTRKFIKDIKKPRLKQLVNKVLSPILPDSALVNLVLDSWFGSSLLPHKFKELKDLVDFVESILEVSPANYQLALSVCTSICTDSVANNTKSANVLFWASSLLVNTIYHAIPVPPEHVWTEAADLLGKLTNLHEISESFHQRALSVYPFSIKLWKSYLNLSTTPSKRSSVIETARDKGIELE